MPFWMEDFTGGIPAGWTNNDASNQGIIWKWCANTGTGCAPVFIGQAPFQSATAETGFVHVNSDGSGQSLPQDHVSQLTTNAINCTGQAKVFVQCQSHIGTFEATPDASAILRVSTDLNTWSEFKLFPGQDQQDYFSPNPYFSVVDISSVAANKPQVYLQWQWIGNWEYMWDLDDIALYDENPTPPNDLAISEFFYPASSAIQPVSQIATDTFGFFAYISNRGKNAQTNVLFKASITTDTDELVYADSMLIPSIAPGVTDSLFALDSSYVPVLPVGEYRIKYSIRSDSTDDRPVDNKAENAFYVSDNLFSKEAGLGPLLSLHPAEAGDWYVGNLYRMSAGNNDQYRATLAEFAFNTDPFELSVRDVEATLYLLRVSDDVNSDFTNFDRNSFLPSEFTWVGFANYVAPDTIGILEPQTVELLDVGTNLPGVILEKGARYILAIGYAGTSNVAFHAFDESFNMLFVSTLVYGKNNGVSQWSPGGFGSKDNAVLRMAISLVSTTDTRPLPETSMQVFPNPVRDILNLAVNFDKPTEATITLADLSGRVIRMEDRSGLTQDQLTYNLSSLASGTYLARIATPEGTLTKKFVLQR